MWRTGEAAYDEVVKGALGIGSDDLIIGFIYVGTDAGGVPISASAGGPGVCPPLDRRHLEAGDHVEAPLACNARGVAPKIARAGVSAVNAVYHSPTPCPFCGFSNEGNEKFCGGCGRVLTAGADEPKFRSLRLTRRRIWPRRFSAREARSKASAKQVTVLFADLKGSMELLADRDPEEARKLLDPVLERMMESVHRYEGTVNQVMGDGIMALFGAPVAHEDHAVRACYAALQMQELVKAYADQAFRTHGITVRIRVGLNSGEVLVRSIRSDLRLDYSAVGQTTHLAARMEQLAPPGTVWMTAQTLRLVESFVQVQPLGPVPVHGLDAPIEVFELIGAGPSPDSLSGLHACEA